jgi:hypothetical protein
MCNFGSEDKFETMPQDMQTLLKSSPKKMKKKAMQKKNNQNMTHSRSTKSSIQWPGAVGKTFIRNYVKRGCQRCIVAKHTTKFSHNVRLTHLD